MLFFTGAYRSAKRAMAEDQHRVVPSSEPLWRLILDEIALLARRIGRLKIWTILAVIFACFFTVNLALSPSTPGPALADLWRWLLALVLTGLTLIVWAVLHAVRSERSAEQTSL